MTNEEFIEKLKTYSYERVGDKIIVNDNGSVYLVGLTSMPSNVEFNNLGYVDLRNVTSIPSDVKFNNDGYVDLGSATSISSGVLQRVLLLLHILVQIQPQHGLRFQILRLVRLLKGSAELIWQIHVHLLQEF